MLSLPLIERELRVALRKQRPVRARWNTAAVAVLGCVLFVVLAQFTGARSIGQQLEGLLCMGALYLLLRVPFVLAGVVSEERREQTLELLALCGLGASQVFGSKLLSSVLLSSTHLLAIVPMMALPFLLGGVPFDLFAATCSALPVLLFFVLAASFLSSTLASNHEAAVFLAFGIMMFFCGAGPLASLLCERALGSSQSTSLLLVSPAYGPYLIWSSLRSGFGPGELGALWNSLYITLGWSALLLGTAGFILRRLWQARPLPINRYRDRWQVVLHGSIGRRRRLAKAWLGTNPFVWLAARDRQPTVLGWVLIGTIALLWLGAWALWPRGWVNVGNLFVSATLLNMAVSWLIRQTAAGDISKPRRDGSYELLLTTPLNPEEIVSGTYGAVRERFRWIAVVVFLANLAMMVAGIALRPWTLRAAVVYAAIWVFLLSWSWGLARRPGALSAVMWAGLNSARPAHAVLRIAGVNGWAWIWVVFNLQQMGRGLSTFPTGSMREMMFLLAGFALWLLWGLSQISGRAKTGKWDINQKWDPNQKSWIWYHGAKLDTRLIREFREIVREPVPRPDDPRFKKWNPRERFPWGFQLAQEQLHERLARQESQTRPRSRPNASIESKV